MGRAFHEDREAIDEIVADSRMPTQIREALQAGGARPGVHAGLVQQADAVEAALKEGASGRDRLLQDPKLSAKLREQLANIPARAFSDPPLIDGLLPLFRNSILAQENWLVRAASDRSLKTMDLVMGAYAEEIVNRIQRGIKEAFSASITQMLARSLWIVILGVAIILFIPELPLRSREPTAKPAVAE